MGDDALRGLKLPCAQDGAAAALFPAAHVHPGDALALKDADPCAQHGGDAVGGRAAAEDQQIRALGGLVLGEHPAALLFRGVAVGVAVLLQSAAQADMGGHGSQTFADGAGAGGFPEVDQGNARLADFLAAFAGGAAVEAVHPAGGHGGASGGVILEEVQAGAGGKGLEAVAEAVGGADVLAKAATGAGLHVVGVSLEIRQGVLGSGHDGSP